MKFGCWVLGDGCWWFLSATCGASSHEKIVNVGCKPVDVSDFRVQRYKEIVKITNFSDYICNKQETISV